MPTRLLLSLVAASSLLAAFTPARACTSPYSDRVTSVVPLPESTDVPLNALIVVRIESVHLGENPPFDQFGWPRRQITLVEQDSGAVVGGTLEEITGGPGRYTSWQPLVELRFRPTDKLKPRTRYGVQELSGYSFTTGVASEPHPVLLFAGVESAELTEVAEARNETCISDEHVGQCPSLLHVGWKYPVHARLSFTPLNHLRYGTWAYRYRVVKVDEDEPVMDFIAHDTSDHIIDFVFQYAEGCYKVVAIALDGTTLDNDQVTCLRLDQAQTVARRDDPDTSNMFCNRESGFWEEKDGTGDKQDDPPSTTDDPDDPDDPNGDPPAAQNPDGADDPGATARRSGCGLAGEAPAHPSLLLLLVLSLWAARRRRV